MCEKSGNGWWVVVGGVYFYHFRSDQSLSEGACADSMRQQAKNSNNSNKCQWSRRSVLKSLNENVEVQQFRGDDLCTCDTSEAVRQ